MTDDLRTGRMPAFPTSTRKSPRGRVRLLLALASAGAWVLLAASSAPASTVTLGLPLTSAYTPSGVESQGTFSNGTLGPGARVTSPVTGTIDCWKIKGYTGGPFKLRVLKPITSDTYKGVSSSTPQKPKGTGTQSFKTDLPIKEGEAIGIDDSNPVTDKLGQNFDAGSHLDPDPPRRTERRARLRAMEWVRSASMQTWRHRAASRTVAAVAAAVAAAAAGAGRRRRRRWRWRRRRRKRKPPSLRRAQPDRREAKEGQEAADGS